MANSMDPDQTAPIGAVCSGSTLFASILYSSVMLGNFFAADDSSRRQFQMHSFLGALRVKSQCKNNTQKSMNAQANAKLCKVQMAPTMQQIC